MDFLGLFEKYWPFMALVLWFAYKWWNSKRVVALLPELKKNIILLMTDLKVRETMVHHLKSLTTEKAAESIAADILKEIDQKI